jgi:large subunit ribosomal protein L4
MKIDVFTSTGQKKGTVDLPAALFETPINQGLMHQVLVLQQSNRRKAVAHVKHRGEVQGSTRKLFQQKHTGRARRGPARSPLLRGGGKSFGPRSDRNFSKAMPRAMRHRALLSCLSLQGKHGAILGLDGYPDATKTKDAHAMLQKMPVELGRKILIVTAAPHRGLLLSTRNIPRVRTITASYLNPEDVLGAHRIIFLVDALSAAEKIFAKETDRTERAVRGEGEKAKKAQKIQKTQRTPKKISSESSASSSSS